MSLKMDSLSEKLCNIKLFLFDLQGVLLSDQEISMMEISSDFSEKLKSFNSMLIKSDLHLGIITGFSGPLLDQFSSICSCDLLEGSLDKVSQAEKLLKKYSLKFENLFYMGDSILDLPLLQKVGLSSSPENSERKIRRRVDFICTGNNGKERLDYITELLINNLPQK